MKEPFVLKEKHLFVLEKWQQLSEKLKVGFTTKNGGVSKGDFSSFNCGLHVHDERTDVLENRRKLADLLDFPLEDWVAGEQIHGNDVRYVTDDDRGKGATDFSTALSGTDGLLTKGKGILLTAFFADCIPLFFFDPVEEMIGIAHAGWKGTVKEIAGEMVNAFKKNGSKPEHILVAIGPGISKTHYEVDTYVASQIDEGYRKKVLFPLRNDRYLLDLLELNKEILLHYGIFRHNIDKTNYCTFHDDDLFFSHRRDQGRTGRMLGFIGMMQ